MRLKTKQEAIDFAVVLIVISAGWWVFDKLTGINKPPTPIPEPPPGVFTVNSNGV